MSKGINTVILLLDGKNIYFVRVGLTMARVLPVADILNAMVTYI